MILGFVDDDIKTLESTILYLKKFKNELPMNLNMGVTGFDWHM